MQKKGLWGTLSEYLVSVLCFGLLVYLDINVVALWRSECNLDERAYLVIFFMNLMLLMVVLLPLVSHYVGKINNEKLSAFLGLSPGDEKITYLVFYDFLSGLALSAFYLSVLIYTLKGVFEATGWFITGLYLVVMYIICIYLGVMALIKFIWTFRKLNKVAYGIVALTASAITLSIIDVAMKMVS